MFPNLSTLSLSSVFILSKVLASFPSPSYLPSLQKLILLEYEPFGFWTLNEDYSLSSITTTWNQVIDIFLFIEGKRGFDVLLPLKGFQRVFPSLTRFAVFLDDKEKIRDCSIFTQISSGWEYLVEVAVLIGCQCRLTKLMEGLGMIKSMNIFIHFFFSYNICLYFFVL